MKKNIITLFIGLFMFVYALGFAQDDTATASDEPDPWHFGFSLYTRDMGIAGTSLNKNDMSQTNAAFFMRIRPVFTATKGGFTFNFGIGTDIYFGATPTNAHRNGGYFVGGGGAAPTAVLQLRDANVGYAWENGSYFVFGVQNVYIPSFDNDLEPGVKIGWKNDVVDINAFYYQMTAGDSFTNGFQNSGFFGAMADITVAKGVKITPYIVGMYQGNESWKDISSDVDGDGVITGADQSANAYGYNDVNKFMGNIGVIPGIDVTFDTSIGVFGEVNATYVYGKNDIEGGEQTRSAFGAYLNVGYKEENHFMAQIFGDFRQGNSSNVDTDFGTNTSFNGAMQEYDAHQPPLFILYNSGDGRWMPVYGDTSPDGFAFSDRGAVTIGASTYYQFDKFRITMNLGNSWYAAGSGPSNMGFELDFELAYYLMKGLDLYIQEGTLFAGKGLTSANNYATGSDAQTINARIPYVLNFGMKYSL